jgi:hypothetical protein
MKKSIAILSLLVFSYTFLNAQNVVWPAENIQELTSEWTGERTDDGRPKVSDELLERLKKLTM